MNPNRFLQSKMGGSAMVLALLAVVILSVTGVGLLAIGLQSRLFAIRNVSEMAARCAADAGLTEAILEMNKKLQADIWDDSTLPRAADGVLPNCNASFSYAVTKNADGDYVVESTGKSGRAVRTVNCTLPLQGPFEYAVFAQGVAILKAGTLVDTYNSLDPLDTDVKVQIGTSSVLPDSIILNSRVVVNGDVVVGVSGDVESVIRDRGTVTGDKYAISEEVGFPAVAAPVLDDRGGISVHGTTLTIMPADSGKYEQITLKRAAAPAILEIKGGDVILYVTGDIKLGESCEIMIDNGASLTLYLDGDLDAGNNAGINNKNSPTKFKLYGTAQHQQNLNLKAKSNTLGAVYAPNADIVVMATGDLYGAFIGKSFEMKSGGNLYYDAALRDVDVSDEAVRFVVRQWSEQ